jgi:nitric oxide reductase subunit B
MQTGTMDVLRWLRIVGDTIFAVGILALGWFVVGLKTGWSVSEVEDLVLTGEEPSAGSAASPGAAE